MSVTIRQASLDDVPGIMATHKAAATQPVGLARTPEEITESYVRDVVEAPGGVCLVAVGPEGDVCGEIHARRERIAIFSHVLGGVTVAVRPNRQGQGVGSKLFKALIAEARTMSPPVLRIELAAGAGNLDAIRLYERLGFQHEGRQPKRGLYPDGRFEDDILMGMLL